jgi:2-polyprenyl-3-methyl-5-hydroxy-6-metoxy-1,4-benzoquinol methylase
MDKKYSFKNVEVCNMCQSKEFKTLGIRLNQSQGKNPKSKTGIAVSIYQCTNCDLIYSNPQPIPNSIDDHYKMDPNKYWSEEYFILDTAHFQPEIEKIKSIYPFQSNQKVLDIGAGLGKTMKSFESNGYDVYGLEPSSSFYDMAITKMEMNKEKLIHSSLEEVSYSENQFDIISFGAVLEHLYDPNEAIQKALKWLKPGGIIHAEIPHSKWLIAKLFNLYYAIRGTNFVTHLSPMHQPFHLYEFSEKSFIENGKLNNYTLEKIDFFVGTIHLPKIVEMILNPLIKWLNRELVMVVYLKKK